MTEELNGLNHTGEAYLLGWLKTWIQSAGVITREDWDAAVRAARTFQRSTRGASDA